MWLPEGARLVAFYRASGATGANLKPWIVVRNPRTDALRKFSVPYLDSFTTDRTRRQMPGGDRIPFDCEVVAGAIEGGGGMERGQFYVEFEADIDGERFIKLSRGYLYSGFVPSLGDRVEPGPAGGNGYLSWVEVFHNRAGNAVATDYPLSVVNTLRKVYGVVWYYHADGNAATRVFSPSLQAVGGAKPTGFTLTGNNALYWWSGVDMTLTVNEEGAFISYASEAAGRSVSVDNGTDAIRSSATDPTPWPLWVHGDEPDTIMRFPAVTGGLAGDTQSAYIQIEEWLTL